MKRNNRKSYLQLKAKYPDTILLLRSGDIYKSWDNDAETINKKRNDIQLKIKNAIISCDISIDELDQVMQTLIKAGHRIGVCDPV